MSAWKYWWNWNLLSYAYDVDVRCCAVYQITRRAYGVGTAVRIEAPARPGFGLPENCHWLASKNTQVPNTQSYGGCTLVESLKRRATSDSIKGDVHSSRVSRRNASSGKLHTPNTEHSAEVKVLGLRTSKCKTPSKLKKRYTRSMVSTAVQRKWPVPLASLAQSPTVVVANLCMHRRSDEQ